MHLSAYAGIVPFYTSNQIPYSAAPATPSSAPAAISSRYAYAHLADVLRHHPEFRVLRAIAEVVPSLLLQPSRDIEMASGAWLYETRGLVCFWPKDEVSTLLMAS